MDREAWQATVHGVAESVTTGTTHACNLSVIFRYRCLIARKSGAYFLTIKNDTKNGVRLILESAEAGDPGGQYMLFRCLYYTKGIVKDKELAMKVLKLSADQGFIDSVSKWNNLNKRNKNPTIKNTNAKHSL